MAFFEILGTVTFPGFSGFNLLNLQLEIEFGRALGFM